MGQAKILVVDDDADLRNSISEYLLNCDFEVLPAESCGKAERMIAAQAIDAMVLDHALPDGTGLELLRRLKSSEQLPPTVMLTGHSSIELAVSAIKEGAENFLTKPVTFSALQVVLQRMLEHQRDHKKARAGRGARDRIDPFLGTSAAIRRLADQAVKVAAGDSPVLIQGETGCGKGVLARWIHDQSSRSEEAFVDLNCAGLTRDLLESELFGHEKGAFTSALNQKAGLFEVAHHGTFFLDEIGDLDLLIQPKLLKVVEEKHFRRLGSTAERRVDVRLIAASHQDIRALVKENKFRDDLYFRISTIPLRVPPLRERSVDISDLARVLLGNIARDLGRERYQLSEDAIQALSAYRWPGNIRELRNVLERAVLLSNRTVLKTSDLHFEETTSYGSWMEQTTLTLEEVECLYIKKVLDEEHGNVIRAAERLAVPRSSLYNKLKVFKLPKNGQAAERPI